MYTFLGKVKKVEVGISITKVVQRKNSSDLDTGRRPKLKSDEFFLWTPLVIEMWRYEDLFTIEKMLHLFGASLRVPV